jgi:hypothetical protein
MMMTYVAVFVPDQACSRAGNVNGCHHAAIFMLQNMAVVDKVTRNGKGDFHIDRRSMTRATSPTGDCPVATPITGQHWYTILKYA